MRLFSRLFGTSKKEPVYGGMNGASSKRGFFGRKKASTISMGTPKKVASKSASAKESATPKRRRINLQSTGKVAASIAILMSLATAITLLTLQWQTNREIRDVRIKGSDMVSLDEVYPTLEFLIGQHPDSVSSVDVLEPLSEFAAIRSAHYWVDPSGTLVLDIEDRTPVGLWFEGVSPKLVSTEGVFLPYQETLGSTYPIIVGFGAGDLTETGIQAEEFESLGVFLEGAQNYPTVWSSLSEVGYHPTEGIIALSHEAGVKLIFGSSNLDAAMQKWTEFYTKEALNRGMQTFHTIDLRYRGQIVVKENPDYLQTQFIPKRSGGSS